MTGLILIVEYICFSIHCINLAYAGLEISARPLANASVKPFGRGWPSCSNQTEGLCACVDGVAGIDRNSDGAGAVCGC